MPAGRSRTAAALANPSPRYHFISGLPRSGSTLLCGILRQNPRFLAGMTSPVAMLALSLLPIMSSSGEFAAFFTNERRRDVFRAVFNAYYEGMERRDIVFDTNRVWCGRVSLLAQVFPGARVICCVREIGWVIDSVERMLRRNPLEVSKIFQGKKSRTLYSRVDALMNTETGLIGAAWSNLREAWFGDASERLVIVSYEGLTRDPQAAIRALYTALDEPLYEHDFDNVRYEEPQYDADLGMPGLHTVRPKVQVESRMPCIPPDVFAKYAESAFWRGPTGRQPGPTIIC